MTDVPVPSEPVRYYRKACKCGHVIEGTYTFGEHWVEMMAHAVGDCPLVSKKRGRQIMAMFHRDNLGEFDSHDTQGR
jgi:hypothetical protein